MDRLPELTQTLLDLNADIEKHERRSAWRSRAMCFGLPFAVLLVGATGLWLWEGRRVTVFADWRIITLLAWAYLGAWSLWVYVLTKRSGAAGGAGVLFLFALAQFAFISIPTELAGAALFGALRPDVRLGNLGRDSVKKVLALPPDSTRPNTPALATDPVPRRDTARQPSAPDSAKSRVQPVVDKKHLQTPDTARKNSNTTTGPRPTPPGGPPA